MQHIDNSDNSTTGLLNASNYLNSSATSVNVSTTSKHLTEAMFFIRDNITRVLNIYFENISDENGHGAATTPLTTHNNNITSNDRFYNNNNNNDSNLMDDSNASIVTSSNGNLTGVNAVSTFIHMQMENVTSSTAIKTTESYLATNLTAAAAATTTTTTTSTITNFPNITYPSFGINNFENCSSIFKNYTSPQHGSYCTWTWDRFLCWPPTPVGTLARMHCPAGFHGIDTNKFANRKCELNGLWGSKPNDVNSSHGWTDYQPCYKPEVFELLQKVKDLDIFLEIAQRTRVLEIVGLILSFFALIVSLIIFYNFRSLRNNRTKIHKNLFFAMVFQVLVRLTLYLDQAFRRGQKDAFNENPLGIESTQYVCKASYILLEYARTAMFMWMFIEGLYLHNMVTVAVFHGHFPHTVFFLIGWGLPIIMTTIWALCTAIYTNSVNDCFWNYNLTPYYWILEGPRNVVIVLNFFFLMNIIRVLVMKLRQSQASDIEQTRKAVRAAIVLLPLLGITNILSLVPDLNEPWKFALWSYVTHFLKSFQGFFIALIYCFLNGEVRAVLMKSAAVYMSAHGHPNWLNKRASLYSGAFNTAPDSEGQIHRDDKTNVSPKTKRKHNNNNNTVLPQHIQNTSHPYSHIIENQLPKSASNLRKSSRKSKSNNSISKSKHWIFTLCFRAPKGLVVPTAASSAVPPESVVFELSEQ